MNWERPIVTSGAFATRSSQITLRTCYAIKGNRFRRESCTWDNITRLVSRRDGLMTVAAVALQLVEELRDAVLVAVRADAAGVGARRRRRHPEVHEARGRVHADVLSRDGRHRSC